MQTATVSVSNTDNTRTANNIQLLFDSGSQRSYISTEIRNRLKLPTLRTERLVINTFGNQDAQIKNIDVVPLTIICPDRKLITVECLCTSMICADVTNQNTRFVSTNYVHLKNLNLADCSRDGNKKIDVLIRLESVYKRKSD